MTRKKENQMRISTVIKQLNIPPHLSAAVLVKHNLKTTDRIEPDKFVKMVEEWRRQPVGGK